MDFSCNSTCLEQENTHLTPPVYQYYFGEKRENVKMHVTCFSSSHDTPQSSVQALQFYCDTPFSEFQRFCPTEWNSFNVSCRTLPNPQTVFRSNQFVAPEYLAECTVTASVPKPDQPPKRPWFSTDYWREARNAWIDGGGYLYNESVSDVVICRAVNPVSEGQFNTRNHQQEMWKAAMTLAAAPRQKAQLVMSTGEVNEGGLTPACDCE